MLLGCPFLFTNLGNIELDGSGLQYTYRFKAEGGVVTGIRLFLIFRAAGYFAGNGGQVQVDLCTDGGTVLDSFTDTAPMSGGETGAKYPLYPFSATLTAGSFYRINFYNPAGSPSSNWVSIDDGMNSDGATQPGWAELGISAIQGGSQNPRHTPCFEIVYSGGAKQGVCWIDVPSGYQASSSVTTTFVLDNDQDITDIFIGLRSGSGTLNANLKQGASTLWSGSTTAFAGWVRFAGIGQSLSQGVTYTITATGSFVMRPLQKGTSKGFQDPSLGGVFSDSRASNIIDTIYLVGDEGGGSPGNPPLNVTPPAVSGQVVEGQTLTLSNGTWTGSPTFTREWLRCNASGTSCSVIGGQTGTTYVLTGADVGSTIRGRVTGTNGDGTDVATSQQTGVVGGASGAGTGDPVNVSLPTISGVPTMGRTLQAGPGDWDGDTPMAFTYQWRRYDAAGVIGSDIPSASGTSYTLVQADVGKRMAVKVTATN